ncbi:hypothetical protein V6N11_079740 [Hibiscus sabdariffa]|uniref:Uncharacterized protein n=1 Tax=Hibiscus sabdariffa TaxID=183260 RepID=A0ABR2RX04_9ROSI
MDEVLHISGIENARDREILESGIDTTPVRQILESKLGGLSRTSSLSSSQSLIPRAPRELRGDRRLKEDDEKDLRRKDRRLREEDDDLFKQNLNLYFVAQDLLLLENQLPLCLLENFAVLTGLEVQTFTRQALNFFSDTEPRLRMLYREEDNEHIRNTDHLLGLVHHNWIQFPSEEDYSYLQTILFKLTQQAEEIRKHLVRREKDRHRVRQLGEGECDFISSATELSERGIRFRQGEENCLFDIRLNVVPAVPTPAAIV